MTPKTDDEIVRHMQREFAMGRMQEKLTEYPLRATARQLGVSSVTFWKWRTDQCWPDRKNCLKLATLLGLRP